MCMGCEPESTTLCEEKELFCVEKCGGIGELERSEARIVVEETEE